MSTQGVRQSGLALIAGGVLWLLALPVITGMLPLASSRGGAVIYALAGVLVLVGVVGLRRHYAAQLGRLGTVGRGVAVAGTSLVALGGVLAGGLGVGAGSALYLLGSLISFIGAALLSWALLRAHILPRWSILPLLISALSFVLFVVGAITIFTALQLPEPRMGDPITAIPFILLAAFGVGWATLGYGLWSSAAVAEAATSPVSEPALSEGI